MQLKIKCPEACALGGEHIHNLLWHLAVIKRNTHCESQGRAISLVGDLSLGIGGFAKGLANAGKVQKAATAMRIGYALDVVAIAGQTGLTIRDVKNQNYMDAVLVINF